MSQGYSTVSGIRLGDLIMDSEIKLLFESSVAAGLTVISLSDESGTILSCKSDRPCDDAVTLYKALYLEGEETGEMVIEGPGSDKSLVESIAELVYDAVRAILLSSYRTLLVSETRKAVVSHAYEELIDRNSRLAASESRYRKLAERLNLKIRKNTAELKGVRAELTRCRKRSPEAGNHNVNPSDIDPELGFVSENLRVLKTYLSGIKKIVSAGLGSAAKKKVRPGMYASGDNDASFIDDADQLVRESIKNIERIKGIISGAAQQPCAEGNGRSRLARRKRRSGGNNGKHNTDS